MEVIIKREDRLDLKALERMGVKNVAIGFAPEEAVKAQALNDGMPERGIPPRPFLHAWARKLEPVLEQALEDYADIEQGGLSAVDAQVIGNVAKRMLEREIENWTTPPNAPSTIRRKGRDDPLVDTGRMRDNIKVWIDKE